MRMLQVIFTGSCVTPVICGAGTASRTQTQRTISLRIGDRLLHKILEITRRGPVPIRFGGGEPLLYPGLFELLEDCQRHHIPIDMTTNDIILDPEAAKRLKQCGLRTLTVSIDGTEPYHDGLRGGGNFAWACRGMENALQAGNHVGVAFTATACNYKNISDYTEFFHRKGIRELYIFRYIPDPSGVRATELELEAQMLMETTAAIHTAMERYPDSKFSYEKKGHLDFLMTGRSSSALCRFAKGILTVKSDGTVVVCAAIGKYWVICTRTVWMRYSPMSRRKSRPSVPCRRSAPPVPTSECAETAANVIAMAPMATISTRTAVATGHCCQVPRRLCGRPGLKNVETRRRREFFLLSSVTCSCRATA